MKDTTAAAHRFTHVIIVDDFEIDRRIVRTSLSKLGFAGTITEFGCGDDFLDAIGRSSVSIEPAETLILLDINMPRSSGFDVLEGISGSAIHNDAHIVMLSTSERSLDVSRSLELGAKQYVCKPMKLSGYHDFLDQLLTTA